MSTARLTRLSGRFLAFLRDMPLVAKLGGALLLISLPPIALLGYQNLQASVATVRATELRNIEQLSETLSSQITQLIADYRKLVDLMSADQLMIELAAKPEGAREKERVRTRFTLVNGTHPDVELMMLMNPEGVVLESSDTSLIQKNFGFRDYFREAIQGRPHTTSIIVGSVAGNSGIYSSAPVRDGGGNIIAVLVLKISGKSIATIVENAYVRGQRIPFITDSDGVIVYHPDPATRFKSLTPLSEGVQKRIAEDKRFRLERVDSVNLPELAKVMVNARRTGSVQFFSEQEKEMQIAGFSPTRDPAWVVGVIEPEHVFGLPLDKLFDEGIHSMLLVTAIVLLLAWLFSRQILRPVGALTRSVKAVERGDYDNAGLSIISNDEIGRLARVFNDMLVGIRERERVKDLFGRMVSPEVREKLLTGSIELGGESARVTVLFSDIRGFSTICENTPAPEVVALINEYMTEMSTAARNWGGYINNFIGDAIVVVFGTPVHHEDNEWRAVAAALEMRSRLHALNLKRRAMKRAPISTGIGISTGDVVAGQMGAADRFLYTVIGDAVNIAARLEALTKDFPEHPILMNEDTFAAIADRPELNCENMGPQKLKGREETVNVYGIRDAVSAPLAIEQRVA